MSDTEVYTWRQWTDHSTNAFAGWRVTVPASSGLLIVAFLALLIRMGGEAFWKIIAFTLHQIRATEQPKTDLRRQQQVILRNPTDTWGTAWEFVKSAKASKKLLKGLGFALCPSVIAVGFIVAGVFVGRIGLPAYEISQVLLKPTNCGLVSTAPHADPIALSEIQSKYVSDIRKSRAYANQCYSAPNKTLGCASLPAQNLPYTINNKTSCPFGQRCALGGNGAIHLDTGILNSDTHLGINAKPDDRVGFRVSSTCSVIDVQDLTQAVPDPNGDGNFSRIQVYMGPFPGITNYSYVYPTLRYLQSVSYSTT